MGRNVVLSWIDKTKDAVVLNPGDPVDDQTEVEARMVLVVDCTVAGEIGLDASVTAHPVEDGSAIADHVIIAPKKFQMSGIVSNYPILPGSNGNQTVELTYIPIFDINKFVVQWDKDRPMVYDQDVENRMQTAYEMLAGMLASKSLVRIVSDLEVFDNMVCTSANFPRDSKTADALKFNLTFQQVEIVRADYVETNIPPKKKTAKKRRHSKGQQDRGQQPTTEVKDESLALKGAKAMGWTQ